MLEEMDAGQITEWMAFDKIEEEAYKRRGLADAAIAGVNNYKRRGR